MKNLIAVLLAIAMTACAGVQQRDVDELAAKRDALVMSDPLIQRLAGKVTFKRGEAYTLAQQSDNSLPDASQKEAILAWDQIQTVYETDAVRLLESRGAPGISAIAQQYVGASKDNRLDLYQRIISFGEFNRTQKKLYEMQIQLIGKLNAANAQQANAAWADAHKSMGDSFQSRQRSTVNTNCYSFGNSISCSSR